MRGDGDETPAPPRGPLEGEGKDAAVVADDAEAEAGCGGGAAAEELEGDDGGGVGEGGG